MVEWAGHHWPASELPPTAAAKVAALASKQPQDHLPACASVLEAAGLDLDQVVTFISEAHTDLDILDLVGEVLSVGTARPWRSTVGLCVTTTTQWSTIRGRLIDKGIPDPLRSLPSLTALLDVVEVMILDSMDKEEDRDKFINELYRRDNSLTPPAGWEEGADLGGIL